MQAKTIYLKDYTPSSFSIDTIELVVDIQNAHTIVTSKMKIIKAKPWKGKKVHLELNGEGLELLEVKLNDQLLPSSDYQVSKEKLVILNIELDEFFLNIVNKIDPNSNKAMEGFYQSGPQLCTQCEPEGFRKITYFIDRPDVMARYKTKMIANKSDYPFLLSNGNRIGFGDLAGGRHWAQWEDPFRKPSYLFAMVAGDFDVARDEFITRSGRKVDLEIYVDKGNLHKTSHAMQSLKDSMKWDEVTFGLEYDLDIYMIVAVDSFNMGAMENKGLNIFNSTYTLADEKSATDHDFQNIQAVIGHEYFHNWTGNRVTCRDWFQLTLKEGLTVFRDQEFSSDMLSRAVKRLEDVRMLKDSQFAEDAGPLAHPIRPSSYIEINNFYTRTIYEKGAEVIRMIQTLIGKDFFRKGMDKYFELYDGKAVTTEDFVHAMELASGKDLGQFKNWYNRAGTPTLQINSRQEGSEFFLDIEQHYPKSSTTVAEENVLHLPFVISLLNQDTKEEQKHVLELKKLKETFQFSHVGRVIPVLNHEFSAPVHVHYPYSLEDHIELMSYAKDPYCRYEATQKIYDQYLREELLRFDPHSATNKSFSDKFKDAVQKLLADQTIDMSFKAQLLELPSESSFVQGMQSPNFDAIHTVRKNFMKQMGLNFQNWFVREYERLSQSKNFDLTPKAFGERALKNQCLNYLVASETSDGKDLLARHYKNATNMTEEMHGLKLFISTGCSLEHESIKSFYHKWKHDSLVMIKWFSCLSAFSPKELVIERIEKLGEDPLFLKEVPNYMRALYLHFAQLNLVAFHQASGDGYSLIARKVEEIDKFNPQVASRLATSFSLVNHLDQERQSKIKAALGPILKEQTSRDTHEVVSKYLAQ